MDLVIILKYGIVFKFWIKWIDLVNKIDYGLVYEKWKVNKIKTGILFKNMNKMNNFSLYTILMIILCWKWKFAWRADPCPAMFTEYHL